MAVTQNIIVTMTVAEYTTINGAAPGTFPITSPFRGIPGINVTSNAGTVTITLDSGHRRSGNVERISQICRRAEYMYPTITKTY